MALKFPRKVLFWTIAFLGLVITLSVAAVWPSDSTSAPTATVRDVTYHVEIAETPAKRSQGLMGRSELAENQGMLFVFDKPGLFDFWNKDTPIALDLIYIKDSKVVERGFLSAYDPDKKPSIYHPSSQADYVFEINKGEIPKHKFQVGDKVIIKK